MNFKFTSKETLFLLNCGETCEMSALSFGRLLQFFKLNNYKLSQDLSKADHVLINSCCVILGKRNDVEEKLQFALTLPHIRNVVMFGCFAGIDRIDSEKTIYISSKKIEDVDLFFEHHISIGDIFINSFHQDFFIPYQRSHNPDARYVLIAQGCENRCSYCNIKNSKGATESKPVRDILREIEINVKQGFFEFILLADDCGSYGADIGTNIISLLTEILKSDSRIQLRIHYLFPQTLIKYAQQFKEVIASGRINYINVPIQSGSQRILTMMNRNYPINEVLSLLSDLKSISPHTWFYTHIIVNFPSETDDDLKLSLSSSEIFDECLFMNYSRNQLTQAYSLKDVDPEIEKSRLSMVQSFLDVNGKGLLIDDKTAGPVGTTNG
jgi:MiaB/RimO family radical SAM methylthiotransferase